MKKERNDFKASLSEVVTMSKKEFLLTTAVCILGGIVFGLLFSPRKSTVLGSYNGNNNAVDDPEEKNGGKTGKAAEQIVDWKKVEEKELGGLEEE